MNNEEILMEKVERLDNKVNGLVNQVDLDRKDIDNIRMDQKAIKEGQQALLNQMTDFKAEIRQQVQDTISAELPRVARKVIREEIRLLSAKNPKKIIKRKSFWEKLLRKQ